MKITIIRDTVCDGAPVREGDEVDASGPSARYLIATGKAVESSEAPKKAKTRKRAPKNKQVADDDLATR